MHDEETQLAQHIVRLRLLCVLMLFQEKGLKFLLFKTIYPFGLMLKER